MCFTQLAIGEALSSIQNIHEIKGLLVYVETPVFHQICPHSLPQILWTFSIYLESVAILPQLFMISKTGEAETITTHYLFFLGLYRALYLINWIWRFYFEGFFDMIAIVAGVVQTILYCDFFYLYVTKGESPLRRCRHATLALV